MADSKRFYHLSELHTIACAAAYALKSLDGRLECTGESEHFTYEDVAGCVYSIQRSIDLLDQIVKLQGLKGDWIYPDMHLAVEDDVDLSPAAQAVLRAAGDSDPGIYATIAAALRAAADQVAPDEPDYMRAAIHDQGWWDMHDLIRSQLLAIAAELAQ